MARTKSPDLTEAELRLMDVIWRKGSATVAEVAEGLPKQLDLAYNTVLTTLRILEDQGYVRHTKSKGGLFCITRWSARRKPAVMRCGGS